jgi:hypothetical protein
MEHIELDHRRAFACAFTLVDLASCPKRTLSVWDGFTRHPLVPHGFAAQADKLPVLVDLRSLTDRQRHALLDLLLGPAADALACAALLETEASAERLARHCLRVLSPRFPGHQSGIFRFHDPVVFEHLTWMLGPRELAAILGPITAWLLPLRGSWHAQTPPPGPTPASGVYLPPATWQRVQRIGAMHAVLGLNPDWQADPMAWGPRAEALLARAEHHHLEDRSDAIAFAGHGLRWHAAIDQHPRVAALLRDCIGHPSRYRRLTSQWADTDWQTIASDLAMDASHTTPAAPLPLAPHGTCP